MRQVNAVKRAAALIQWGGDMPRIKRFFAYVQPDLKRGCWLWLGSINRHGYGQFHDPEQDCRNVHAFRWSYEYFNGPVAEGLAVDHLCRVRSCVNPDHLEAVTKKENTLRGICPAAMNARKTTCLRGHGRWSSAGRHGGRRCLDCHAFNEAMRKVRRLALVRAREIGATLEQTETQNEDNSSPKI